MLGKKSIFAILISCVLLGMGALSSAEIPSSFFNRVIPVEESLLLTAVPEASKPPADSKTPNRAEFHSLNAWGLRPFVGVNLGFLGGNTELKSSLAGGGEFGLMGDYFMTSIQIDHYSKHNIGAALRKGSFSMTPVLFNFYGKFPVVKQVEGEKVTFRAGGGFNYVFVSHDLDTPQVGATTITEDVDSGLGFHVGGGLDYWIFKNVSLSQDFTYLFFQPDVTVTQTTGGFATRTQSTVRLDTILVLFKVNYHF